MGGSDWDEHDACVSARFALEAGCGGVFEKTRRVFGDLREASYPAGAGAIRLCVGSRSEAGAASCAASWGAQFTLAAKSGSESAGGSQRISTARSLRARCGGKIWARRTDSGVGCVE